MLFFVNFLMLKMGDDPNNQVSLVSWLPVNPNATELAVPGKLVLFVKGMLMQIWKFCNVFVFKK